MTPAGPHTSPETFAPQAPMTATPTLPATIGRLANGVTLALRRHPRRVTAAVLALLGGFAATAFGIAPLAADAVATPVRLVSLEVAVPGLAQQVDALANRDLQLARSGLTRNSDNADTLLRRLGVSDPLASRFLRQDKDARRVLDGHGGKLVEVRTADDGTLLSMVARFAALDPAQADSHFTRLNITRRDGRFVSQVENAELVAQQRIGSGVVRTSLWAAVDEARLPESVAEQLIDIFSVEFDFHRQLNRGATFRVVYEAMTADDHPVSWSDATGRVQAAQFTNGGRTVNAIWYPDTANGKGGYFDFDGKSLKRTFLASPVEFSRMTSGFAMRQHPIFNDLRAHNGVDYAAPTGTPVQVVGDGLVEFAGRQNGYGNVVEVRHDPHQTTLYAHLSAIGVQVGQRVEQGQKIGAVGATGYATGPHLHFEFRVDGSFQDPLLIAAAQAGSTLDQSAHQRFAQVSTLAQHRLAVADSVTGFRGDAE